MVLLILNRCSHTIIFPILLVRCDFICRSMASMLLVRLYFSRQEAEIVKGNAQSLCAAGV